MLLRSGDSSKPDDYELNLGSYAGTILLTLVRALVEWLETLGDVRKFLLGFVFKLLPGILSTTKKFDDVYIRLLKALWLWIGDQLAGAKPKEGSEDE